MKTALIIFSILPFIGFSQLTLVWSDEFNGSTLDQSKWGNEIGTGSGGWGNNELQYYTARPENVKLDSGYLHIIAREEQYSGSSYTSARLKTQGLHDFQYGRMEARIKVPVDQGLWPAFWMLGSNITSIGWPKCGEIDIMEHINHELQIHGTIHFDMFGHVYEGDKVFTDASLFHEYAIEWDENTITWFLDDVAFHTEDISANAFSREEFHNPFFFLLNLAVGGNWPGSPNGNTSFPATMMVDYVRVYQNVSAIEEKEELGLEIYPNPSSDFIRVASTNHFTAYKIFSQPGKLNQKGQLKGQIEIHDLESGMYSLELRTSNGTSVIKSFVKK